MVQLFPRVDARHPMNNPEQTRWTLLTRPRWKALLMFLVWFGIVFHFTDASFSTPTHILAVFLGTLAFIALSDVLRVLFLRPCIARLSRSVFAVGGVVAGGALSLLVSWLCRASGIPEPMSHAVGFVFTLAFTSAMVTTLYQTCSGEDDRNEERA